MSHVRETIKMPKLTEPSMIPVIPKNSVIDAQPSRLRKIWKWVTANNKKFFNFILLTLFIVFTIFFLIACKSGFFNEDLPQVVPYSDSKK
jgi:hypothetical protein